MNEKDWELVKGNVNTGKENIRRKKLKKGMDRRLGKS